MILLQVILNNVGDGWCNSEERTIANYSVVLQYIPLYVYNVTVRSLSDRRKKKQNNRSFFFSFCTLVKLNLYYLSDTEKVISQLLINGHFRATSFLGYMACSLFTSVQLLFMFYPF